MSQTIVVGLDGAGFDLLTPWLEAGELPNLQRILDEGVSGPLRSVLPPVTSPNWKAYATGKNPGKLGIFWWYNIDTRNGRSYLPADRYHEHTEYWELIGERERVGVLGVPTTYPPKKLNGFVVSGAPDGMNTGFASPPELERELRERFDYRVTSQHSLKEGTREAYEEVLDLIDLRFRVAKELMDEWELGFCQVTTFYLNALHHTLWDDEYTLRAWRIIDDHLGDLYDGDRNLVLMSDHGHNEIRTVFRINRWLEREGYLTFDTGVSNALSRLGVHSDRLKRLLVGVDERLPGVDAKEVAERFAPRWFINNLPNQKGELGGSKTANADWDHTTAIASAQGPVYLNVEPDEPGYERLREELVAKLEELTDPWGNPVAKGVYRAEDVYVGEHVETGPDLVVDNADGVHVSEKVGPTEVFSRTDDAWRGVNKRLGLFAAAGPAFTSGTMASLSILDLAPTLLHLHGCAVPTDMDGRVRKSLFASDLDAKKRAVSNRRPREADRG